MKEESDAVLRALGDLLLQLGCDTGWLVPNTSLNTKQLNVSIAKYQALLDQMELEITSASVKAHQREAKPPPEIKPEPEPEPEVLDLSGNGAQNDGPDLNNELDDLGNLDSKYDDLGNGLTDEMDLYDMNRTDNFGMFGMDSKLGDDDGYGMIDDQYF